MSQNQSNKLRDVSARSTATFDLTIELSDTRPGELEEWKIDGVLYAAMLARQDCPKAFREAFASIFDEHLFSECRTSNPRAVEFLFPLVVGLLQSEIPADALRTVEILHTLRDTLAPALYQELRKKFETVGL